MTIPKELENIGGIKELSPKTISYFIYFLLDKNEIVYIGQTRCSPYNRISAHKKGKVFTNIYYTEVPKEKVINLERQYILKFKPRYNKERCAPIQVSDEKLLPSISALIKQLKATMKKKGKTIFDVANELDYGGNYLQAILKGRLKPGKKLAIRIREWSEGAVGYDDMWE
jgi:predicted GIY-YIG superfamily endonuclease